MLKLKAVYILFAVLFLALIGKLFYWQVVRARGLATTARAQYEFGQKISAPRGNILASDGSWLAARSEIWKVHAWIPDVEDIGRTADILAPYFVEDESNRSDLLAEAGRIKELLSREDVSWVPLKTRLTKEVKTSIEELDLPGIGFEPEENRIYPESSVAAHLLGFVGKNDMGESLGYFGLEGYYNLPLSGKPGFLEGERDALGSTILSGASSEISAIEGVDLKTHINKALQISVDKKLLEGIEKYGAKGGSAIIMDPKTGAILAASAFPSFDPKTYYDFSNENFKNPFVSDSFEPGSIFKVIVMAAGLDAGVIKPDTKCDICDRPLKIDKYEIETWNRQYKADSTMTEVLKNSDNVGMAYVANHLGADRFYDYLDSFGIGRATNIDLQGEINGTLRKKGTWGDIDVATVSFGQGVAVTSVQMLKSVAIIANGGVEVTPQVVDRLEAPGWEEDIEPVLGKRVLSEDAARDITAMMVEAAENGESKWTKLRGFKVAGKTGTAQIPIAGHYDAENTIASFIGFAPANDPKFVMLVTLRQPQTSTWASETAAPLWYTIAHDLFMHFGIQPEE